MTSNTETWAPGHGPDVPALIVDRLSATLDGSPVLHSVSCGVASGGWLAVIGPNGAGKSTLLRALSGLIPYQGTVIVHGRDAAALSRRELSRRIAYVPQNPTFPPDMTVAEYVLLGRTPHLAYLAAPGHADRRAADEAMELLVLAGFAGRRLATLSGGERQRAVLARALTQRARLLLLDEPTTALDLGHQQQALDLVDRLRRDQGLTVVTTLHDLTAAGQYAERMILLDRGSVAASGTPTVVLTEERVTAVYRARVSVTTDREGRPVVTPLRGSVG